MGHVETRGDRALVRQRPDALGPPAPRPSKVAGQGGAHAAGSWALGGAAGQSLAPAAPLFAGRRPLSGAAWWGLGNPRAELGAGDHQEVLAAGPEGPGQGWTVGCLPRGFPGSHPSTTPWDPRTRSEDRVLRRLKALGAEEGPALGSIHPLIPSISASAPSAPQLPGEIHAGRGRPRATEELTSAASTRLRVCPGTIKTARSRWEALSRRNRGAAAQRWKGQSC